MKTLRRLWPYLFGYPHPLDRVMKPLRLVPGGDIRFMHEGLCHACDHRGCAARAWELERVVENLRLEITSSKAALTHRLTPYVTWGELHAELQKLPYEDADR